MEDHIVESSKLPKLQGTLNYDKWASAVASALMTRNADEVVFEPDNAPALKGTTESDRADQRLWKRQLAVAQGIIQSSLADRICIELGGTEAIQKQAPHELWKIIQTQYNKKT